MTDFKNKFGIFYTKRFVYIPELILRLPERIICQECKSKTSPAFAVDSYDLVICISLCNIYTSRPFLVCYICKYKIGSFDVIQCEKYVINTDLERYCSTCGTLKKKLRSKIRY